MSMGAPDLRIGTSGWNYPTGRGTWNGVFYPPSRGRAKGFDELSFYAEHFNTVEVNSTFYGQPRPDVARSWAERTPPDFEFSIKLYQKFTHPNMFKETFTKGVSPSGDMGRPGGRDNKDALLDALARPNQTDLDEFRRGIEPLASAGKLGALLAQFPPSFKDGPASRDYLSWLLQAFADYRVAVELRHSSWSDAIGDTLSLLSPFGSAWVQIDEPKFRFSIKQNFLPNVQGVYYMRLHGRNAKQWWHHEKAEDRYNYLYTAPELSEFVETLDAARQIVGKAYLYTNNHFSAKSVANAAMIKKQLGEPLEGEYSEAFLTKYPELAGFAKPPARKGDGNPFYPPGFTSKEPPLDRGRRKNR
jgi:uncharacterized protein YecE (DUF72 family)